MAEMDIKDLDIRLIAEFEGFLRKLYYKDLVKAANNNEALVVDFVEMDKYNSDLSNKLLENPEEFFDISERSLSQIDLPGNVPIRFSNHPDPINIRDLRSVNIGKFISVEGTVRKSSEIRPEIMETVWECPECGNEINEKRQGGFISIPKWCDCGNKKGFKQIEKKMVDTRWIVIEEPFELTEGDRPSQITILLTNDLVNRVGRRISDPGNRLKITGVLKDIPKSKSFSVKLDFFLDGNHVEPTEIGWEKLEITKEEEAEIHAMANDKKIYKKLVASIAPTLYGMEEIKESIVLQIFGGVPRTLKDGSNVRGDIHVLLMGDPASGKSQLMKLVPKIVPRGKYVSGKGVTGAGLCMSYNTYIPSAHDGNIVKIGDVVEDALKKEQKKIADGIFVSTKGNFDIVCLDSKTLKIKEKKVGKFFKLKQEANLLKITTKSGREITLTKENPVLTIHNGKTVWKKINEFKKGDFLGLSRFIPLNNIKVDMKSNYARFIGMVAGDGDVGNREIRFHNIDQGYLDEFANLIIGMGYKPRIYTSKTRIPCVRVASKKLCDNLDSIGIVRGVKSDKIRIPTEILKSNNLLSNFLSGLFSCDGGVVSKGNGTYIEYTTTSERLSREIQTSLLRFGILSKLRKRKPSKKGFGGKKLRYIIIIRGYDNIVSFNKKIGFTGTKNKKLNTWLKNKKKSNTNIDLIPNLGSEISKIRKSLRISIKSDKNLYKLRAYENSRRKFSRESLLNYAKKLKEKKSHKYFNFLETLSKSDIFWDSVEKIEETEENWVYDLEVDGEHNFVANDFIIHNTATVTKDEQFMGGWVLEAGALVLANKGLLSIDEFEKMDPHDQVAMHEALEQGTISIAKASIVATLPAHTSVLAGGNPKYSRFDPYIPIAQQITIADTLLTRFDLKFILKDLPNAEKDKKVVEHILSSREDDYEGAVPAISKELIRKYIAYCRDKCKPILTKESGNMLKKFYIQMRKKAEGGGPVPITLRQFEALIRLAESSAKIQLSKEVRKEDAMRAIRLMKYSLEQLGYDPDTGMIDIDRSEGGTTSSERSKIRVVLDIIKNLSEKKKEISVSEIEEAAKKENVDNADDIIDKLKREGMLFEPNPGYVQKV